jgi:hypothetical protein
LTGGGGALAPILPYGEALALAGSHSQTMTMVHSNPDS